MRSQARVLANLKGGRLIYWLAERVFTICPLTCKALGNDAELMDILQVGTLPEIFSLDGHTAKAKFLKSYAQTYIKEEIISEQIVRNLPPFRRFIDVDAQSETEIISYSNIAKDVHSDPKTISTYYDILEDTLIGFRLQAYDPKNGSCGPENGASTRNHFGF